MSEEKPKKTWVCSACKLEVQSEETDGSPSINGWGARRHMVGEPPHCVVESRGELTCPDCLTKDPLTGRDFDVVFWNGKFRVFIMVNGRREFMQQDQPPAGPRRLRTPRRRR